MFESVPVWEPPHLPVSYRRYPALKRQNRDLRRLLRVSLKALQSQVQSQLGSVNFFSAVSVTPSHAQLTWRVEFCWYVVSQSVVRFAQHREQLEKLLPMLPTHERMYGPTLSLRVQRTPQPISLVDPEERLLLWQPVEPEPALDEESLLFYEPELEPVLDNMLKVDGELTLPYLDPEAFTSRFRQVYEPLACSIQAAVP